MGVQYSETNGFTNLLRFVCGDYQQHVQHGVSPAACSVFCITHRICVLPCTGIGVLLFLTLVTYLLIGKPAHY